MLVITLGDPHSVNIELIAPLLSKSDWLAETPVVLVGSAWQWRDQCQRLGLPDGAPLAIKTPSEVHGPGVYFAEVGPHEGTATAESLASVVRGAMSLRALAWLRQCPQSMQRLAVVTAPIDKYACAQAGFSHGGQTEFFAELWGGEAIMILAGPRLRVGLATNHLALREVPGALSEELIVKKLNLFISSLGSVFGQIKPRIAVCGLNPHAGDSGLFGDEERLILGPAIARVQAEQTALASGAEIIGPVPADTAFYRAYQGGFSGVLAMYHDQGLGPLKTVHFDTAVNVSGGLKHFRASPDHGPARDLFLKGQASNASMELAIGLALNHLRQAAQSES